MVHVPAHRQTCRSLDISSIEKMVSLELSKMLWFSTLLIHVIE